MDKVKRLNTGLIELKQKPAILEDETINKETATWTSTTNHPYRRHGKRKENKRIGKREQTRQPQKEEEEKKSRKPKSRRTSTARMPENSVKTQQKR